MKFMNSQAEQVLQTALSLNPDDRVQIAESLILSLYDDMDPDIESAWAVEIKRRLESIDNGEVKLIPADEVMSDMRKRLYG